MVSRSWVRRWKDEELVQVAMTVAETLDIKTR